MDGVDNDNRDENAAPVDKAFWFGVVVGVCVTLPVWTMLIWWYLG